MEEAYNIEKLTKEEKEALDGLVDRWDQASSDQECRRVEMECLKLFKTHGFKHEFVRYLRDCKADEPADHIERFEEIYHSVPHAHEKTAA